MSQFFLHLHILFFNFVIWFSITLNLSWFDPIKQQENKRNKKKKGFITYLFTKIGHFWTLYELKWSLDAISFREQDPEQDGPEPNGSYHFIGEVSGAKPQTGHQR